MHHSIDQQGVVVGMYQAELAQELFEFEVCCEITLPVRLAWIMISKYYLNLGQRSCTAM